MNRLHLASLFVLSALICEPAFATNPFGAVGVTSGTPVNTQVQVIPDPNTGELAANPNYRNGDRIQADDTTSYNFTMSSSALTLSASTIILVSPPAPAP